MSSKPGSQSSTLRCPRTLDEVDLFSPGAQEHWYDAYPILLREAPVHRLPGEGLTPQTDAFILSRYEDIDRVVKDPIRFTPITSLMLEQMATAKTPPEDMDYINMMMVSMLTLRPTVDLWRAHRKELTDPWVGPGAARHCEMITQQVDRLIDGFPEEGGINFVQAFARPLPQQVMARVLGFPEEDIPQLALWGEAQVMPFVYGKGHLNHLTEKAQSAELHRGNYRD
jgi:cytochrome P450